MDHAQFWSLLDAARGDTDVLERSLAKLPAADIEMFDAWRWEYFFALDRSDLWAAVFTIRGGCSDDRFDYFRQWLIARGEAAVLAAIRDPESLPEIIGACDPREEGLSSVAANAYTVVQGTALPGPGPRVEIPGRSQWPADRIAKGATWDAALIGTVFPALAARFGDTPQPDAVVRATVDPDALSWYVRDNRARALLEQVKQLTKEDNHQRALELLDEAVDLLPHHIDTRGPRGRTHVRLGNLDAALADFDAALAHTPNAAVLLLERAKLLLARGERDRALADARDAAALGLPAARAVLAEHGSSGPPKRVRHAKFGEGSVISIDNNAAEEKLVIEFADGRKVLARRFVEVIA